MKKVLKVLLRLINELLSPWFVFAMILGYKARPAILADTIRPDTYLICAALFMCLWWSKIKERW